MVETIVLGPVSRAVHRRFLPPVNPQMNFVYPQMSDRCQTESAAQLPLLTIYGASLKFPENPQEPPQSAKKSPAAPIGVRKLLFLPANHPSKSPTHTPV